MILIFLKLRNFAIKIPFYVERTLLILTHAEYFRGIFFYKKAVNLLNIIGYIG